jgi:hypothetical protein
VRGKNKHYFDYYKYLADIFKYLAAKLNFVANNKKEMQ